MITKYRVGILQLLCVLVFAACDSTNPNSLQPKDLSSASPRDFLFSEPAGTRYVFLNTAIQIDSNGVEKSRTSDLIELRQVAEVQREGDKSVSRYSVGDDIKTLVANDSSLWLSDSSAVPIYQIHLKKPFILGAVFSSGKSKTAVNDTRITNLSGSISIGGKTYQTIELLNEYSSTYGSESYVKQDTVWFGLGIGVVRESMVETVRYSSGKSSKLLNTIELNSITK